jgi:hypothetical protein
VRDRLTDLRSNRLNIAFLSTAMFGLVFLSPHATADALSIGTVKETAPFLEGAGCSLWLQSESVSTGRYIFLSDFEGHARMNIDGRDTAIRLVRTQGSSLFRVGRHSASWYRGDSVEVRVNYLVAAICAPGEESCEVTSYNATIIVSLGRSKKSIVTKGICGS